MACHHSLVVKLVEFLGPGLEEVPLSASITKTIHVFVDGSPLFQELAAKKLSLIAERQQGDLYQPVE